MTGNDLKAALAAGRSKPSLVLALLAEGHLESEAWAVVRAAEIAHLSELVVALTSGAPTEDGESYSANAARAITLAVRMSVEAEELLALLSDRPAPAGAKRSDAARAS